MSIQFDFVDLRLFTYIAEEKSLTKAAGRACLSLPAASMRIKNLEQSIGVPLLNRSAQGITLRPAGEAFLHHARQVLGQIELLSSDLQEYAKGIKGHVRILANTTAMTEFLPHVLSDFLAHWPDVNIDLSERQSDEIVKAVSTGVTDIGIVAGSVKTAGLLTLPYRKDRLVLAVSEDHELAHHDRIPFERTMDCDYIVLHEGSAIYAFLNRAAGEINRQLRIRIQVGSFEAACRMVAANVGISILPESAARRHARSLPIKLVELENTWAIRNMLICVRDMETLPHFTHELIRLLQQDGEAANVDEVRQVV